MAGAKSLADAGLVQKSCPPTDIPESFLNFMGGSKEDDWKYGQIVDTKNPEFWFTYAISLSRGAMIIFSAFIVDELTGEHLVKDMHLWSLVLATWAAEGSKPTDLRYLGFHDIINGAAQEAIRKDFTSLRAKPKETELTVTPASSKSWKENIFLRSAEHIEKVSKAHMVWEEQHEADEDRQRFHMMAELSH